MCGIAGFVDPTCPEMEARERLTRMLGRIIHRGPDGAGTHVRKGVAIGMRRLSIIDLEGGAQPIWNEAGTIGVVFNGEIYNYVELRETLEGVGHTFSTHSDTEVLVHLYEQYGESMFSHLRGMFAFAILDSPRNRLIVARDHFGQKPLYYSAAGNRFAFSSEMKCLFSLPWVKATRDPDAFLDYAAWMSLPPTRTHFREIQKLAAGSYITVALDGSSIPKATRYWTYGLNTEPDCRNMDAAVTELDRILEESIRLHLRSDVPVGVLLSSGLDSRTVSAYAQDLQQGSMQTFTVGFGGNDSELPEAAATAAEIGARHHALELTAEDLLDDIERVAWHLDEPIGDPAAFAVLRICELARGHVKVLLSGEGADELFGGYDSRYLGMLSTTGRSDQFRHLAPLLPRSQAGSGSKWQRLITRAHLTRPEEVVLLRREGFPGDIRCPRGLTPEQVGALHRRAAHIATEVYRGQRDSLSELLTFDLDWQLAESLLQKADKMSMGASIELRTPLLDIRVAEFAARVPSSFKLPPGGPGKLILRHCLGRKLNEPISRPKRGFPIPLTAWFAGPLRHAVESTVFATDAACSEWLDPTLLRAAWNDFLHGEWDGARAFYALWLYEVWCRSFHQ